MTSGGVDPANGAQHLRAEEDVVNVDHLDEQVDPGLVVHAGIEVDVLHEMRRKVRLVEHVRETAVAAPVVGDGTTPVGDHEAQVRKRGEQITLQELHEGGGVGVDVVRARGVKVDVATARNVNHRWHVEFDHGLVDGEP